MFPVKKNTEICYLPDLGHSSNTNLKDHDDISCVTNLGGSYYCELWYGA